MIPVESIVLPLVPLVLPLIIAVCVWAYHDITSRLPEKQRATIDHIAYLATSCVEQLYADAGSAHKKDLAMQMATSMLAELKLPGSYPALLSAAIEAAVHEMNAGKDTPHAQANPLAPGAEHA
jgi:LL-H family phage holin